MHASPAGPPPNAIVLPDSSSKVLIAAGGGLPATKVTLLICSHVLYSQDHQAGHLGVILLMWMILREPSN